MREHFTGRSEIEPVMGYRRECLIGSMARALFGEEDLEGQAGNRSGWRLGSVRSIVAARAWYSPAPGLTGRGVPETERFEIIPGGVQKTLRTLIVDIEIPWTGQREQRRDSTIERTNAGDGLAPHSRAYRWEHEQEQEQEKHNDYPITHHRHAL